MDGRRLKKLIQTLYSLLSERYSSEFVPTGPEDRETRLSTGIWVRTHDIPELLRNRRGLSAVAFFLRYKKMGMPYGPWGENPEGLCNIVDILTPIDSYYNPPMRLF